MPAAARPFSRCGSIGDGGLGSVEIEAVQLAFCILKEGWYPPTAMRDAIVRMHRITLSKRKRGFPRGRVGFLDTHPSNDRRIAHILSAIHDVRADVTVEAYAPESP